MRLRIYPQVAFPPVNTLGGQLLFEFDFSRSRRSLLNAGGIVLAYCIGYLFEFDFYSRVTLVSTSEFG